MDVIRVKGKKPLLGDVNISGAKNAALPIFAATLLTDEPCTIENVPDLSDVRFMADILVHLGATVERLKPNTWRITASNVGYRAPYELVRKMRASVCLLGPLMGRLRQAEISLPGGCVIGPRPIDLHLKGLSKLGAKVRIEKGYVHVNGKNLRGNDIFLGGRHGSTVTGTANMIMAAVLAPGITEIESAACEPEIADLCKMLLAMGADIEGVGSHHLVIRGVDGLTGCRYRVISDRIEAGTFLIAGAITRGDVLVNDINPEYLHALLDKFEEANIEFEANSKEKTVRVLGDSFRRKPVDVITLPHPGFPTDLQAQMCSLLSITPGLSIVTERIYPNRFMHVPELLRMGANISIEGASAIINGGSRLSGAPIMASDLRASAALLLAGLAAESDTWIQRVYHIDRGYEHIDDKFLALGADIERLPAEEMPRDLESSFT